MKQLPHKFRPKHGFAHFFHLSLVALLPIAVFILVRQELYTVALAVILLSKWRIFAVRPRHWLAHVRTNAVDIIFSVSVLAFMIDTSSIVFQLVWLLVYEFWVLVVKPGSKPLVVTAQALLAQAAGLTAVFLAFDNVPMSLYIIGVAVVSYYCARHFFASFEEPNYSAYAWIWTLFSACLTWLLSHWLLFYGPVAQPAVLLSVIGYGLTALYYLSETGKLSKLVRRQLILVMLVVVMALLVFSDWGSQTI